MNGPLPEPKPLNSRAPLVPLAVKYVVVTSATSVPRLATAIVASAGANASAASKSSTERVELFG